MRMRDYGVNWDVEIDPNEIWKEDDYGDDKVCIINVDMLFFIVDRVDWEKVKRESGWTPLEDEDLEREYHRYFG